MIAFRSRIIKNPVSAHRCCFCESYHNYMGRPGGNFVVICGNCGARGPMTDNWKDALDYWENGL